MANSTKLIILFALLMLSVPAFAITENNNNTSYTYFDSPYTNYGPSTVLKTWKGSWYDIGYIYIELPNISNAVYLNIYVEGINSGANPINIYKTSLFNENTITWSNQPEANSLITSFTPSTGWNNITLSYPSKYILIKQSGITDDDWGMTISSDDSGNVPYIVYSEPLSSEVISPIEDAYVDNQNPNTNYGSATYTRTYTNDLEESYKRSYFSFNISNYINYTNVSTTFYWYYYQYSGSSGYCFEGMSGTGGLVTFFRISSNFDEDTITWNNIPSSVPGFYDYGCLDDTDYGWHSFDITFIYDYHKNLGHQYMSFGVRDGVNNGIDMYSYSKEGTYPPYVLVVGNPPPTPPPNIDSYSNNKTNDNSLSISVFTTDEVNFNATANQPITTWNWYEDNVSQSNNFDNFTTNFTVRSHTIKVNASNSNGISNTITWNITSQTAPRNVKIAVILAEPSDDSYNTSHDKNYYLTKIIPDLKDYYREVSYRAVNIIINPEDVYDNNSKWYKLGKTATYYGKNFNKIRADNTTYETDNSSEFQLDAVAAADNDINFSKYDAVVVIHANESWQESSPNNPDLMTTHAWMNDNQTKDGDIARNLILNSEYELMGTWAHEVGHALGRIFQPSKPPYYLPDLYGEKGVKNWDLMGSGNWVGNPAGSHPVHMSSYSKDWIGWLKNISVGYGTYWINSLATMNYGDEITRYITKNVTGKNLLSYYIIEIRTNNPAYSKWDTSAPIPYGYSNALVLYQVEESGKNSTVNYIANLLPGEGFWDSSYWDFASKVRFKALEERNRTSGTKPIFEMKVGIQNFSFSWLVGAILEPIDNLMGYIPPNILSQPLNSEVELPDLDLHAYTPDGRHVGINYTTRIYENEIQGANASGDLLNGREWIFVPDNIKVQFVVDSKDNQKFLNSYPELQQITNGTQSYNLSIVYDVPDDIRYSTSVEQSVQPDENWKYNYSIAKNTDGTYSVEVDTIPPEIEKPLHAVVKIEPRTLNINSNGKWIEAEIRIPGYDASLIDVTSIRLNGIIPVDIKSDEITEDYEKHVDGPKLKVKFDRIQVQSIVSPGNVTLYISGKVNGVAFIGNDTIRVIENHTEKEGKREKNKNKGGKL